MFDSLLRTTGNIRYDTGKHSNVDDVAVRPAASLHFDQADDNNDFNFIWCVIIGNVPGAARDLVPSTRVLVPATWFI